MPLFMRLALAAALVAGVTATQAGPVSGQGTWETTLKARDINGHAVALDSASAAFFYDTTLNVTWLANMNAAAGTGFDQTSTGQMQWPTAKAWATSLTLGGYSDWRLPSIVDSGAPGCDSSQVGGTDCGYNPQTQVGGVYSEWAHLFYVTLGNWARCAPLDDPQHLCSPPAPNWGLSNSAYFQDMKSGTYWSDTAYISPATQQAWYFNTSAGNQGAGVGVVGNYGVAVRPGDVLNDATAVPEPRSLVLALTALAALGAARRHRPRSDALNIPVHRRNAILKTLKTWAAAAAMVALAGAAQAALVNRGGGMIYDTTRNITWLADMNHARTSGHTGAGVNADGTMTWGAATDWANNLVYGGYDDWRLPTVNPSDTACSSIYNPGGGFPDQYYGTGCTGGELSGLFVTDLGNKANQSVLNPVGDTVEQIANLGLFSNVQSNAYWSGTAFSPNPDGAWLFYTNLGGQIFAPRDTASYALAVRPGDVAASVPEPQTLALALLALGATAVARRGRPG